MFKNIISKNRSKIAIVGIQIAMLGMIMLWVMSVNRSTDLLVKNIGVTVDEIEGERNIVSAQEIKDLLQKKYSEDLYKINVSQLPLVGIEKLIRQDTRIYSAEVFVDLNQNLQVEIVQRRPIARVMDDRGNDYYLDQDANYITTSSFGTSRVPVITGSLEDYKPGEDISKKYKLNKVFIVLKEILKDEFLKSLVEQIYSDKGERIIIIPKIGNEKIIIDYIEELPEKFRRLKIFYHEMAKKNSWGTYDEIDISYKNQIVGRNLVNP